MRKEQEIPLCSIVIPARCEAAGLKTTAAMVATVMGQLALEGSAVPYEMVFVDDGSPDGTWETIRWIREEYPQAVGVRLTRRFGKEGAMRAGLSVARGQAVVVMDADLQHPPQLISEMLRRWHEEHFDIVEGVKESRESGSFVSRFFRGLFFGLSSKLTGVDLRESCDFKLLDRRVVNAYLDLPERNLFFRGMTQWLGYRTLRLSFTPAERLQGETQWSFWSLARLAMTAITSFSVSLLHLVTLMGCVFVLLALLLAGQTLYNKISGHSVDGFTTVILLLLIIGSVVMLALGVIGEYLARIYEEVKRRPLFVVDETLSAQEVKEKEL